MATIVQERRQILIMEPEERKNILFHIAHIEGLPIRPGWTPLAGTYISVENIGTKEVFDTEHKKITPGQTKWVENLPLLQATDTTSVRFLIKHSGLLNKRSVLGTTDTFTIQDLLGMQQAADHGIDKLVKLLVTLDPAAIRTPNSAKSPRLSRSSLRSPRTSLDVPASSPQSRSLSPTPSPFPITTAPRYATLYLKVRETAVDPGMNIRVNASNWKTFVEKCRNDSLQELRSIVERVMFLRSTFEQDSNCICLIDIILGAIEATANLLSDPDTMNVNRHITHVMMSINSALAPYLTFSRRQLSKRGETSMFFLQEMLFNIVSAMWTVGAVFAAKGDALVRDKLESKVITWTDYFQNCTQFLSGQVDQRPSLPTHQTSPTRAHCPKVMGPNSKLAQHNMISMTLPDLHSDAIYTQGDVVRHLSEWVFSSTFNHALSPTHESITFAMASPLSPTTKSPISQKEIRRPAPLDLKDDDNFTSPQAVHSILRPSAPGTKGTKALTSVLPVDNVFCLSGPARSGKTQLAARMSEWLVQLNCLGGYFTFDGRFSPRLTLDSLPMTLIHQIVTTERASISAFGKALSIESDPLDYPLEVRFEKLFVEPLNNFVTGRVNAKWNPLDPLVFIIDGIGVDDPTREKGAAASEEDAAMAQTLVDTICSGVFGKLPRYVKFLVFMRSGSEVERLLKEKGMNVFEMGSGAVSSPEVINGGLRINEGRWPVNSGGVKSSSRPNQL